MRCFIISSFAAFTVVGITGCATAPPRASAPDIVIPVAWTAEVEMEDGAPGAWLKDFDSPELYTFTAQALEHSPSLLAAAARFDQAIAEAQISGAAIQPTVSGGLNGSRQKINNFGPQSVGGTRFDSYDLSLSLNWEVDLWGRLRDETAGAIAQAEASAADYYAAKLSLVATVAKGWFQMIEASQQVELARQTANSYRANLDTLEGRFKRGLTEGLDLRLIRAQSAFADADLNARKRAMDRAKRNLEIVLGEYPSATLTTDAPLPIPPETVPAGQPIDLLTRRPDLAAAERRLAGSESTVSAAKKERLPQISLTASGGTSSQEFKDLLDSDFSVWSLGGNLTQPILQGGRIKANIARETALRAQAEANYKEIALQAFFEVETTLSAEAQLLQEYRSLEVAAEESESAEALAWSRYRKGTADFITVLDAQRSTASARSRLISLRSTLLQNRVDLYLALGGPFLPES